ncbi:MAG: XkdX family protein [Oscillospiraceae bacterium]
MDWYAKIKEWHTAKFWTAAMVQNAVVKLKLTQAQADEIVRGA